MSTKSTIWRGISFIMSFIMFFSLFSDIAFTPLKVNAQNNYTSFTDGDVILTGDTVLFNQETNVGNTTFTANVVYTLTQIAYDSTLEKYVEVDEYVADAMYAFKYLDAESVEKYLTVVDGNSTSLLMTEISDGIVYRESNTDFEIHENLIGVKVKVADSVNLSGKYVQYGTDQKILITKVFTLDVTQYNETEEGWMFISTENEFLCIPGTNEKTAIGFTITGGNGSENNPYALEVIYEKESHSIIKSEMINGDVAFKVDDVEVSTAKEDDTVTIEIEPNIGYELNYILASKTCYNEPTTIINEINDIISLMGNNVYYKNGIASSTTPFIKKGQAEDTLEDSFDLYYETQDDPDYQWYQNNAYFGFNKNNAADGMYEVEYIYGDKRTLKFTVYNNTIISIIVKNCGNFNGIYILPEERVELTQTQTGSYTFTQPNENVIVYAGFIDCGIILDAGEGLMNLDEDGVCVKKKFSLTELKNSWDDIYDNTVREGYDFLGWYDNENQEFTYDKLSSLDSVTKTITLHAKWTPGEFLINIPLLENGTITATNGVTITDGGEIKAKYGDTVTITVEPKKGYSFNENSLKVIKGESEPENAPVSFNEVKDFIKEKCIDAGIDKADVIFVNAASVMENVPPKKAAGYVCSKDANNDTWTFTKTDTGIVSIYYGLGASEYEQDYLEGGKWIYFWHFGTKYLFMDASKVYPTLTKIGTNPLQYTFTMPTDDATIEAAFEEKTYTVDYVINEGQKGTNSPESYKISSNTFSIPMPTYNGTTYAFNGWKVYNYGDAEPDLNQLDANKCIATNIMDYSVKKGTTGNLVFEEMYTDVSTLDDVDLKTDLYSELDGVVTSYFYGVAIKEYADTEDPIFVREELKINRADVNNANEVSNDIKSAAGTLFTGVDASDIEVKYINMNITKYTTKSDGTKLPDEVVSDIGGVFEICIPFVSLGYTNVPTSFGIIREHGTGTGKRTDVFKRITERVTAMEDMVDATFYVDTTNNNLCIYTRYFSTYAIVGTSETIYQVTLDVNEGNALSKTLYNVVSGGTLSLPTPTRSSYTFDGWYTLATGGTKITSTTPITKDMTLYAHWTANGGGDNPGPTYYTITFNSNGGSAVASQSVISGGKATKPADPTKEGFTFDGWYSDTGLTTEYNFNDSVYSSKTLYAKWKEIIIITTYTVTFDSNGGSTIASQSIVSGNKATKPDDPTKEGFTFDGWYSDAELTAKFDFNTAITKNTTLYAKWNEVSSPSENTVYTVTFDSNGGNSVSSQTVVSGNKATKPDDPTNDNLVFIGWFVNPTLDNIINEETLEYNTFDFNTPINEDITLKALWLARLTVNASAGGQIAVVDSENALEFSDEYPYQSSITNAVIGIYDTFVVGAKADKGYKFVKWQKKIGEDQYEDYSTDAVFTVTITDFLNLVAVFEESTEISTDIEHPTLYLKANVTNKAKNNTTVVKLSWKKIKDAESFEIYGAPASEKDALVKVETLKKNKLSYTMKDLEWGKEYVYLVKAIGADGTVLMESLPVYFVTGMTFESNAKSISAKSIKVRMGETAQIQPTVKPKDKGKPVFGENYTSLCRYFSSNPDIAEVDKNGLVTAKAVGKVTIFIYAPNGVLKKVTANCESPLLFLKASVKENAKDKTSKVVLNWTTAKGATEYNIYGAEYGVALEKIATVKKNQKSYTISDLEWGKEYGYIVKAVNADGTEFWESTFIHFVAGSDTQTNAKNVKASNMTLTVGSTDKIVPTMVGQDSSKTAISGFTYFSLQPNVVTVDEDGTVNAVAKGKATVYIFAPNGVKKSIKITVK